MLQKAMNKNPDTITELQAGLAIDEHGLDQALIMQTELFWRVSRQLAQLISKRDGAKQQLTETEARVDVEVRRKVADAGERTTENDIKARVTLDPSVLEDRDELLNLSLEVGLWSALKESYEQRSYAMKELVALYIGNYWGDHVDNADTRELKDRNGQEAKALRAAIKAKRRL